MIITNTREGEEFSADKLDNINNDNGASITIKPADSASSSAWLRSKDPRIVRVSRAFGGKDRHSKVCTIRGLRDRRVRLSVPTAIQLYDLQDRLGLNQPSKVVDWLLNVAKDDIDELPPLQIPPGFNFIDQAHQAMLLSSHAALGSTSQGDQQEPSGSKINATCSRWEEDAAPSIGLHKSSSFWSTNSQSTTSTKFKHVVGAKEVVMNEKEMWTKGMQEDDDHHKLQTLELSHGGGGGMQQAVGSSSNNYFPRSSNNNHSSLPNFLHSTVSPYAAASYYHFDYPSNFSLSSSQAEDQHHQHHNSYNVVPLLQSTSLSLPSGPAHVLVCPPYSQSYSFPNSHVSSTTAAPMELDPRQFINHFQILSPSQQQNSLHMSLDDDDVNKKR
ncbi:unnamed protein product [Rhodiola kirilowii]